MKNRLLFLLLTLITSQLFAQQNTQSNGAGKLSGKIVDSATMQPVAFASVSLYAAGLDKPVNGTTTNDKGLFSIDHLPAGAYRVVVDFVGFKSREKKNIVISSRQNSVNLGTFALLSSTQTLSGVVITARKGLLENKVDKMVYNAEKDITSQGGVATDLLKKIPMVSVDVDGNVELQGNSNIRFLINGKPSSIFGNNLADALQTIPASQIKSIEVITSPGAKYDAEGTGGVINIILKESRIQGVNGNINLSAGTRLENGSMNFNARKGSFGIHSYFSGNAQLLSTTLNSMNRPSFDSTGKTASDLLQTGQSSFIRNGYNTGFGFEWNINKRNSFSGNIGYNNFGTHSHGFTDQQLLGYDANGNLMSDQYSVIRPENRFRGQSTDWSLNYRKTFAKEGQELFVSYQSSQGNNKIYFDQSQNNQAGDSLFAGSYSSNGGTDHETSLQADYTQPFSEKVKLEAGAKMDFRRIMSNTDAFLLNTGNNNYYYDSNQSNALQYNRKIYAVYGALFFPLGKIADIKSGLRYERTNTDADFFKTPQALIPSYDTWAPSINISHSFENEQSIRLSYTKRIQRPSYRWLNPFVNASDPKNLSQGNPLLKPEIGNNYELAYNKSFQKGGSLNLVFFYHRSSQDIQPYLVYYPSFRIGDSIYNNVSVNTPENIGTENNYGLSIYGSIPFTTKLNVRSNVSLFDRYIENGIVSGQNINSFNYRINMNITYEFNKDFVAEAYGNFNSPRNEVQGRFPAWTSYNIAFRKQVWNKKGSFGLTATNPFNNYIRQTTAVTGQGFVLNSTRELPFRSFGISFMYKFGKLEFKKEKEDKPVMGGEEGG